MLTVVCLSILKHKLGFLLQHGTFTASCPVCVVTRSTVNWLAAKPHCIYCSQQVLMLLAVTNPTLIGSQLLLSVA